MNEDFDQFSEEELKELKDRFFQMQNTGNTMYFDVDEYEGLIEYFFENDETENVEVILKHALEQHPGNDEFLLKKAQLFALNGQDEQGLKILDDISSLATDHDYYMIRGTLLSNLQKYREAIEEYTKALHQGEDLEEVYSNIAFEYENLEQFDKAVEFLIKVLEINPDNEAALNEIGICYEMSNQSEKSVVFFNQFIDKNPYSRSAWFNLAIALNSLGKNKKAINAYEYSLAIDENQASALFNIANIYASMDQHERAIEYYEQTLSKETPDAITYYYMGESFEKMDHFDEAVKSYGSSFHINNGFHEALIGMARCHFSIGEEKKAFEYIAEAVQLDEPFPLFWSIRSLKLDEQGFFKLAYIAVQELIKTHPEEPIFAVNLAMLMSNHDMNHSIQILNDALIRYSKSENLASILFLKGLYQIQMGKIKLGLRNFEKGIMLNKNDFENPLIQGELSSIGNKELMKLIKKHKL